MRHILVAVAWPYVNGSIHVGHYAGCLLPADIVARFHRLRGNKVLMVSGSDCFGTPITVEADKCGVPARQLAESYHPKVVSLFEELKLSYDLYTHTMTDNHRKVVQDFFVKIYQKGVIVRGSTRQYFSPTENRFLPDRYVEGTCPKCGFDKSRSDQCDQCGSVIVEGELGHAVSRLSGEPVELRETEHYFFDYSKVQNFLEQYFEQYSPKWRKWIRAETNKWLNEGLRSRAITRDLDWGIPIPIETIPENERIDQIEHKRLYVWFDAVIGYFSASLEWAKQNGTSWEDFWYDKNATHYYFMGKDNLVFHTLFWPAYLHLYDEKLHLPDIPAINQYLTIEGEKFSKSRGVTVDPAEIARTYGLDALRFYIASINPETSDSDFSSSAMRETVNGKLIAKIGNFINRALTLAKGLSFKAHDVSTPIRAEAQRASQECIDLLEQSSIRKYTERILALAEYANSYITEKEPWALRKEDGPKYDLQGFQTTMTDCLYLTLALVTVSTPLLIDTQTKFAQMVGLEVLAWPDELASTLDSLLESWNFDDKPLPLFQRLEE